MTNIGFKSEFMALMIIIAVCGMFFSSPLFAAQLQVLVFDRQHAEWYAHEGQRFTEAHPNVEVEVELVPGSAVGLRERIITQIGAGMPPDIADNVLRFYYDWADAGLLINLLPLLEADPEVDMDIIMPGLVESKLYKGKLYSAPTHIDPIITLFDGQAFQEAGLIDPYALSVEGTWCWSSALSAARKLVKKNADDEIIQYGWSPIPGTDWSYGSFIAANGGRILSEDLRRPAFHEPPAVEALSWLASVLTEYQVGRRGVQFHTHNYSAAMATGVIFHMRLRWDATQAQGLGVASIPPARVGKPSVANIFADGPIVFKTEDVQMAEQFVLWVLSKEAQKSFVDFTGRVPSRLDVLPYWAEIAAPYIGGADRAHVFSDAAATGRLLPFGPHYSDVFNIFLPAFHEVVDGKVAAGPRLREAAERVQQVLDDYYGD